MALFCFVVCTNVFSKKLDSFVKYMKILFSLSASLLLQNFISFPHPFITDTWHFTLVSIYCSLFVCLSIITTSAYCLFVCLSIITTSAYCLFVFVFLSIITKCLLFICLSVHYITTSAYCLFVFVCLSIITKCLLFICLSVHYNNKCLLLSVCLSVHYNNNMFIVFYLSVCP